MPPSKMTKEDLLASWMAENKPQHLSWKDRRAYETGALVEPDKWVWVEHPSHSDYYPKEDIKYFAERAAAHGIDPYDFIALGISESGLGMQPGTYTNPTRVDLATHYNLLPDDGKATPSPEELIDFSAEYLAKQFAKYKDRAKSIQAYSGTGSKIYPKVVKGVHPPNTTANKFFGKAKEQIDAWKDQPQSKRVMSISEQLRRNPDIAEAVERAFKYWREE